MTSNNGKPAHGFAPGVATLDSRPESSQETGASSRTLPDAAARTRVALVLDRSGSMEAIRREARDAFNEAIGRIRSDARESAESGMETSLSVVSFNHQIQDLLRNAPAEQARLLGPDDYAPQGTTALLDAVGHAIDRLEAVGPLGEQDAALVIVISDGHENASRSVTRDDLVERMQALEKTEQWTFSFLMANVDITDLSKSLGTEPSNYARWKSDPAGAKKMAAMMALGVEDYMNVRRRGLRWKKDFFEGK